VVYTRDEDLTRRSTAWSSNERAQLKIYEEIQGMTHEQERAYFEQQTDNGRWQSLEADQAADRLGINRNTLTKKLKEYGLEK